MGKHKDVTRKNKLTAIGKRLYKVRCSTIEQRFANTIELHGYQYAQFQGLRYHLNEMISELFFPSLA
uniref:transposase n=1 Tax=Bacillus thuringiensis TaxID=1428 RepID=UPI003B58F291